MSNQYDKSPQELRLISLRNVKRIALREEYLGKLSNPHMHGKNIGAVFDPVFQRYVAMKSTRLDYFKPNRKNSISAFFAYVIPTFTVMYFVEQRRKETLGKISRGEIPVQERCNRLLG